MMTMKQSLVSILAASILAGTCFVGSAFADICERIDFDSRYGVMDQVERYLRGDDTVTARDAACIVRGSRDSEQHSVAYYLANRLENPAKVNTVLDAVRRPDTRAALERELNSANSVANTAYDANVDYRSNRAILDLCGQVRFARYYRSESVLRQVRELLRDGSTVYAQDAACVVSRVIGNEQREVGVFLVKHLEDPYNVDYILNAIRNHRVRSDVEMAYRSYASNYDNADYVNPYVQKDDYYSTNNIDVSSSMEHGRYVAENVHGRIDFSDQKLISRQLQAFVSDKWIRSADAAAIIKDTTLYSAQREVAKYLVNVLVDYNNASEFINAISDTVIREEVLAAGYDYITSHANDSRFASTTVVDLNKKINYAFSVSSQAKFYLGNSRIYARDAAIIVSRCINADEQADLGAYLVVRLADSNNAEEVIRAANQPGAMQKIIAVTMESYGNANQYNSNNTGWNSNRKSNYQHRSQSYDKSVVVNVNEMIDYSLASKILPQVKQYVGNAKVYADDAAEIVAHIFMSNIQKEVGAYLIEHLVDRENVNLIINEAHSAAVKDYYLQIVRQQAAY